MNDLQSSIALSPLDERRFGMRTARATGVTALGLPALLDFCDDNGVVMLIARCAAHDLAATHAMGHQGFELMDTLVYYGRALQHIPPLTTTSITVRAGHPDDAEALAAIARRAFHGYDSHYHADRRLDRAACDEVYAEWAWQSARSHAVADEVLIAELDGAVIGFGTLRATEPAIIEGGLFAVCPSVQRRGTYHSIMVHALAWCAQQGAEQMVISTQITNLVSQKVWCRLGFVPQASFYTFHKWFTS